VTIKKGQTDSLKRSLSERLALFGEKPMPDGKRLKNGKGMI